jgi:hypothetical protein
VGYKTKSTSELSLFNFDEPFLIGSFFSFFFFFNFLIFFFFFNFLVECLFIRGVIAFRFF